MAEDGLRVSRRNLPHWILEGATYFITFRTKNVILTKDEQKVVLQHIIQSNKQFYLLYAAVVMPDHVHLILQPKNSVTLSKIMKGLKGVSSRKINKIRVTKGSIWLDESYDRILRNEQEFLEKMNYILNNPAKQGLTDNPLTYHGLFICND